MTIKEAIRWTLYVSLSLQAYVAEWFGSSAVAANPPHPANYGLLAAGGILALLAIAWRPR